MSSAGDIGTMCSNMNIISCTNAKTTNVLDKLNNCKEYVTMETDAFVVAAMMKYFGLNDINIPTESFVLTEESWMVEETGYHQGVQNTHKKLMFFL